MGAQEFGVFHFNDAWGWEGKVARRLREKYSDKVVLETRKLPQLICNCFECVERYLDKSKGFNEG